MATPTKKRKIDDLKNVIENIRDIGDTMIPSTLYKIGQKEFNESVQTLEKARKLLKWHGTQAESLVVEVRRDLRR